MSIDCGTCLKSVVHIGVNLGVNLNLEVESLRKILGFYLILLIYGMMCVDARYV